MPISVSSVGRPTRDGYEEKGGNFKVTSYMGGVVESEPQAFLVHDLYSPGYVAPHFHHVRQFQVIVSKGVKLGPREVSEVSFHYADPSTPYGPIIPGEEEPLAFFTLRAEKSDGTYFMPGSRDKLERKAGRRNIIREVPAEAPANEVSTLIERHDDGLAAFRVRISAGQQVEGVADRASGGSYYLVMDGSLIGSEELPRFSLLYAGADEPAPLLNAGDAGADVLIMQFPVKSPS